MLTKSDVIDLAKEDPYRLGALLRRFPFMSEEDIEEKDSWNIPDSWSSLTLGDGGDFYDKLFSLWRSGCERDAFAPTYVENQLRFSALCRNGASEVVIIYILADKDDPYYFYKYVGFPPMEGTAVEGVVDYGALSTFSARVHRCLRTIDGETFVRYPTWPSRESWREYSDEMASYYNSDDFDRFHYTDHRRFYFDLQRIDIAAPNMDSTVRYAKTGFDFFVEPGTEIKFWKFYDYDQELSVENKADHGAAVSAFDANLIYVLGGDPTEL